MKKRKIKNKIDCIEIQNPVAKFAYRFHKDRFFCDKSKYSRKFKHNKQKTFPLVHLTQNYRKSLLQST